MLPPLLLRLDLDKAGDILADLALEECAVLLLLQFHLVFRLFSRDQEVVPLGVSGLSEGADGFVTEGPLLFRVCG